MKKKIKYFPEEGFVETECPNCKAKIEKDFATDEGGMGEIWCDECGTLIVVEETGDYGDGDEELAIIEIKVPKGKKK